MARKISNRLADDAIVARVNGDLWDLNRALESDAKLEILTTRNPEAPEAYRHSAAHLLAAVHVDPIVHRRFQPADPMPHFVVEDFRAAAGQRIQAGVF